MAWRYFQRDDFMCKHCAENQIQDALISLLDDLREKCGFPLMVSSGYRCPDHNEKVSSTGRDGPHVTGKATDLAVSHEQAVIVLHHALQMPFTGIGINQKGHGRFIHLDCVDRPKRTMWSY